MNKPINFQTILNSKGEPEFVVVPYADFIQNYAQDHDDLVPDAVVKLALDDGLTPVKAWRTYLNFTQAQVAQAIGVTQGAYSQLEAKEKHRKASRQKIAAALGIKEKQLDF